VTIDEFNELDAESARVLVSVWAAIPVWANALVAARPYTSAEALADAAAALAQGWTRDDLESALAHHPRIGARASGTGAEAVASRSEQASMTDAGADVAARMAAGNAAYEERFGRVFLIRAAGRSPEEMLAELDRRLGNDAGTEIQEATSQLAEIALLRLRSAVTDPADEGIPA
jgi:2-oxo-4-hydroxy-4-carboxy-5-ureidoimidazoline decarboxylase